MKKALGTAIQKENLERLKPETNARPIKTQRIFSQNIFKYN